VDTTLQGSWADLIDGDEVLNEEEKNFFFVRDQIVDFEIVEWSFWKRSKAKIKHAIVKQTL